MQKFNKEKAINALLYLYEKAIKEGEGEGLNKMKALKLIWLADRYHLRHYGRTITGDTYFAMKNGPVASCVLNLLKNDKPAEISSVSNSYFYKGNIAPDLDVFSDSEEEVINLIFENFGKMSEFELSDYSHKFPEWKKFESELVNSECKRGSITIEDFFKNVDDSTGLFNDDEELLEITKTLFEEYQ